MNLIPTIYYLDEKANHSSRNILARLTKNNLTLFFQILFEMHQMRRNIFRILRHSFRNILSAVVPLRSLRIQNLFELHQARFLGLSDRVIFTPPVFNLDLNYMYFCNPLSGEPPLSLFKRLCILLVKKPEIAPRGTIIY